MFLLGSLELLPSAMRRSTNKLLQPQRGAQNERHVERTWFKPSQVQLIPAELQSSAQLTPTPITKSSLG